MKTRSWLAITAALLLLTAAGLYGILRTSDGDAALRGDLLAAMPGDASSIVFVDLAELRKAPFFAQVLAWAPKPQADADYLQFVLETGFDYERDLDRIALAVEQRDKESLLFGIADGKFDRKKIADYAAKKGLCFTYQQHEICTVPEAGSDARKIYFTFWTKQRMAITDDMRLVKLLAGAEKAMDAKEWQTLFNRLAGSPIFAVVRQNGTIGTALAAQAPGGLQSPQLSTLLDQLDWITVAAKPEGDALRVVVDGECPTDASARQLADVLNGIVIIAQAGLNDSKARQQMAPTARAAYLELLKSADISKIDRGDTKSVRVVLDITQDLLNAARIPAPAVPLAAPSAVKKPAPKQPAIKK